MKTKLTVAILAVSFIFIFSASAFASDYLQRINFGYAYNAIGNLNDDLGPDSDLSEHNFYMENASLFGIKVVPNLYIGFKNTLSFSLNVNDNEQALVRYMSLLLAVEYDYPIKESGFTIGAAFNAGFNAVSLIIRKFDVTSTFASLVGEPNYTNLWRPYFAVGGSINAAYQINPLIQVNLNAGALYNIGISEWLDLFNKLEGSSDILSGFLTIYTSFGVGFSF